MCRPKKHLTVNLYYTITSAKTLDRPSLFPMSRLQNLTFLPDKCSILLRHSGRFVPGANKTNIHAIIVISLKNNISAFEIFLSWEQK